MPRRPIRSVEWQKIRREADSDFEADVYSTCEFIKTKTGIPLQKVAFIEHHKYTPDRVYDIVKEIIDTESRTIYTMHNTIYIELKAAFNDRQDSLKYPWIKKALGPNEELVFLLKDPNIKKFGCKKLTMGQWCERHGFRWFTQDNIHTLLEEE